MDEELVLEVFARFGRAVFCANCLERAIAEGLMHIEWRPRLRATMTQHEYEESYDAFVGSMHKLTMGQLATRLKNLPEVPDAIKDALDKCVTARNVLAHHYFWERAGHFAISDGQRQMLYECDTYKAQFEVATEQIDRFLEPYRVQIGLSPSVQLYNMDRLIDAARSSLVQSHSEKIAD